MNGKKAKALRRMMAADNPKGNGTVKSQKEKALDRLRKSGLFEMDMESWIEFFDENPDCATPGFVSFVISQRNLTNSLNEFIFLKKARYF